MIVFELFVDGARYVPHQAPSGGGYCIAAPASPLIGSRESRSLITVHSDEELLYFLKRGYSVRMVSEEGRAECLTRAEDIAVRFVPPYR